METYAQSKVYFDNDQICMAYLRVPIPSMALVDQKKHQIAHYLMQKNIEVTQNISAFGIFLDDG